MNIGRWLRYQALSHHSTLFEARASVNRLSGEAIFFRFKRMLVGDFVCKEFKKTSASSGSCFFILSSNAFGKVCMFFVSLCKDNKEWDKNQQLRASVKESKYGNKGKL